MEKKSGNTIMLTVIAIATLLVAVVGATFAYFSANVDDATKGTTTVTANTAAADVFVSEGNGSVSLAVTADKMQQANGNNNHTVFIDSENTDNTIDVKLTAGSSVATCEYNLYYTPSETGAYTTSTGAQNADDLTDKKEFTISGTRSGSSEAASFTDFDLAGITAKTKINDEKYSISDVYTGNEATAAVDTWTFTAKFYNLGVDQVSVAGNTYGGTISIDDVVCTNAANGQ
ncbi:MAG: hypothetical protein IJA94_00220 [Bacilli bacterium]|nr:hypothetical protein [Bacilli bacterium]